MNFKELLKQAFGRIFKRIPYICRITKLLKLMFWYEDEVKRLEEDKKTLGYSPKVVFYGSSSIRLWKNIGTDFSEWSPINLGFGGSTLASCVWFFKRITKGLKPTSFIIYAGDNDLGDGRHPEEVYISFKQLVANIRSDFGNIPILYISVKPSILRWNIIEQIKYTNKIIEAEIANMEQVFYVDIFSSMLNDNGTPKKELFDWEGLHINDDGYALWKSLIFKFITENRISLL